MTAPPRVALVTGASRGIGAAIATSTVVNVDIDVDGGQTCTLGAGRPERRPLPQLPAGISSNSAAPSTKR